MEKKTLQEIKDNLAIEAGYISWGGYVDSWRGAMPENVIDIIAKAYAKQVETKENQKQLLVDLMKTDQESGMYDSPKIESTPDSKPDFDCPHCKGSGGVTTGENEYSTCPCVGKIHPDFEAMAKEYTPLPEISDSDYGWAQDVQDAFMDGAERIWKEHAIPVMVMNEGLVETCKQLEEEIKSLREERTNHIHEIVRLNEELSKYDSHHP